MAGVATWLIARACNTQKPQAMGAMLPLLSAGASGLARDCMPVLAHTMTLSPNATLGTTTCDKAGAMDANNKAALAIQFHSL